MVVKEDENRQIELLLGGMCFVLLFVGFCCSSLPRQEESTKIKKFSKHMLKEPP